MNKIYIVYVVLSSQNNNIYLLSKDDLTLSLPIYEIISIDKLKQEARYVMKNFFVPNTYDFIEECNYNFLDIQEEYTIEYINGIYPKSTDNNLYITYGGIAKKSQLTDGLYWNELVFNHDNMGYTTNKSLNLLIDNVINKTAL